MGGVVDIEDVDFFVCMCVYVVDGVLYDVFVVLV